MTVSNTKRVCNSIWRNVATRAKQMSSKILSVREKARRQFLQQKLPYCDSSRVGSSLEKSSIFQAIFYYWRQSIYNDANTSLNNFLKTLSKSGQIAPTVHKQPLTKKVVAKLYGEGELVDTDSLQPHKLQQTAWFFLSVCSLENEVVKTSSF